MLRPIKALAAQAQPTLRDGRTVSNVSVERGSILYELRGHDGQVARKSAKFEGAGLQVFAVGAGPGGRIFGSTVLPLELFDYTPATGELRHLGNPTDVGGEIYSFATDGALLYLCAYPQSFLSIYDPAKPWHYGKTRDSNPRGFGFMGDGHLRPRAMVIGPDDRVYVGSFAPYGQTGGALGVYDPKLDVVAENYRHIVTNQSISALAFDPQTKRLFVGSSIAAGGGAVPTAKECVVFAWDTKAKSKEWEETVVKGDSGVSALTATHGKIFGVSLPSNTLFVLDAKTFAVLSRARIPFGHFHEICLGYYAPHNRLYGLAGQSVFLRRSRNLCPGRSRPQPRAHHLRVRPHRHRDLFWQRHSPRALAVGLVGARTKFAHHLRHGQCRLGGFGTTIMLAAQAAHARLRFVLQQQHLMDHRHLVLQLNLYQRLADRFADVRGVDGFASQDDAEADDC